jgi:hypothetical protein
MQTLPADDISPEVTALLNRQAVAYNEACDRMDRARRGCQKAKREAERIIRQADEELNAADVGLAACEQSPGIPLTQYRERTWTR